MTPFDLVYILYVGNPCPRSDNNYTNDSRTRKEMETLAGITLYSISITLCNYMCANRFDSNQNDDFHSYGPIQKLFDAFCKCEGLEEF